MIFILYKQISIISDKFDTIIPPKHIIHNTLHDVILKSLKNEWNVIFVAG